MLQEIDPQQRILRRKQLRSGKSFSALVDSTIVGEEETVKKVSKRAANGEKISINLGVKRITIGDSPQDVLPSAHHQEVNSHQTVQYIVFPNTVIAIVFCAFIVVIFSAIVIVLSIFVRNKRFLRSNYYKS